MKTWIYWSKSNSWIYFYIVLNKNGNIYWSNKVLLVWGRMMIGAHHEDWTINKNKQIRPKLKISLFPLTRPTMSKSADLKFFYWKFAVTFFFSFHSKFVLLKIPYFKFALPKDQYFRFTEHIFVVKKKSLPTYPLPKLWVG
jgi:hypothetical protein